LRESGTRDPTAEQNSCLQRQVAKATEVLTEAEALQIAAAEGLTLVPHPTNKTKTRTCTGAASSMSVLQRWSR